MKERHGLFRPEAVLYKSEHAYSQPVFKHNRVLPLLTWLSAGLLLAAILVLCLIRYKETESARGILEPKQGSQEIVAPVSAMVRDIKVKTGQVVEQGQVLATLSVANFDHEGRRRQAAEIERLQQEQTLIDEERILRLRQLEQSRSRLESDIEGHRNSLQVVNRESEILQQQLDLSNRNLRSLEVLLGSSAISRAHYDQRKDTHFDLLRQKENIEYRRQQLEQDFDRQISMRQMLATDHALAEKQMQKNSLQLEYQIEQLHNGAELAVVAEREGTVAAIAVSEGMPVRENQPLFVINAQDQAISARVFVSSRVIGKLAPGQSLLLSYDAFDHRYYGRYAAIVTEISRASIDPREHALPLPDVREPVFPVIVQPEQEYVEGPDIFRLQPGLFLTAEFVGAEMSLLGFIFKPLFTLRGKIL